MYASFTAAPEERDWVSVDEGEAYVLSMCDKTESNRRNLVAGFDLVIIRVFLFFSFVLHEREEKGNEKREKSDRTTETLFFHPRHT